MNKNSIVPMYQQVADGIRRLIETGAIKEGEKLMTEFELEKKYKVSRITIRKAIGILSEGGYVIKKQGIGTFVTARKINRVFSGKVMSFTEVCQAEGKVAGSEILEVRRVKAGSDIASCLENVEKGDEVLKVSRLRKSDGEGVMIEDAYFPVKYAYVTEENLTGSIYSILKEHGVDLTHSRKIVDICYAREKEAELLNVKKHKPLLFHEDFVYDSEGEQVQYSRLIINPERYRLTIVT